MYLEHGIGCSLRACDEWLVTRGWEGVGYLEAAQWVNWLMIGSSLGLFLSITMEMNVTIL